MFIDTSRRRSPSTGELARCLAERVDLGFGQVLDLGSARTPAALQIACARARPMPKICVKRDLACLLVGMLMPAIRAM